MTASAVVHRHPTLENVSAHCRLDGSNATFSIWLEASNRFFVACRPIHPATPSYTCASFPLPNPTPQRGRACGRHVLSVAQCAGGADGAWWPGRRHGRLPHSQVPRAVPRLVCVFLGLYIGTREG